MSPSSVARFGLIALRSALLLALILGWAAPSHADAIYAYVGNPYSGVNDAPTVPGSYTTSMFVSGSITLSAPLAPNLVNATLVPLDFSFSDGRRTATPGNVVVAQFTDFSTDALGELTTWRVRLDFSTSVASLIDTTETQDDALWSTGSSCGIAYCDAAGTTLNPGVWTITTVPEPSTGLLLAPALVAALLRTSSRKHGPRPRGPARPGAERSRESR